MSNLCHCDNRIQRKLPYHFTFLSLFRIRCSYLTTYCAMIARGSTHTLFTSFSTAVAAAARPRMSPTITALSSPNKELSAEFMATLHTFENLSLYPPRKNRNVCIFLGSSLTLKFGELGAEINWFHSPALTSSGKIENYDNERFPSFLEVFNIHLTKFIIYDAATLRTEQNTTSDASSVKNVFSNYDNKMKKTI